MEIENTRKRIMEEEKYYIPDIKDFYIGYECEYLEELPDIYQPYIFLTQDVIFHNSIGNNENFRTKYLDKSDIESLGFIFNSKGCFNWFEKQMPKIYWEEFEAGRAKRDLCSKFNSKPITDTNREQEIEKLNKEKKVSENGYNLFIQYKLPDSTMGFIKADSITPEIEFIIKNVLEKLKIEIK